MLQFRIFGIPVTVQPFFWLTLGILGALNTSNLMQDNSPLAMLLIALFVLAGFISILVHELGHALMARYFGARVEIVLQAFGGYARFTTAGITRLRSICISAAGPVLQILLGYSVSLLARQLPELQPAGALFLLWLIWISWVWALFNLLPILPLDGGRILQAALGRKRLPITLWVGVITAAGCGIWAASLGQYFIAIFLGMFGYQSWQALQQAKRF